METREVDPDGAGPIGELVSKFAYDYRGNLIKTTDPRGVSVSFEYDIKDRLISTIDATGIGMRWAFDDSDNIVETSDGVGTWTTTYDTAGLPFATIDPLDRVSRMLYTSEGQQRIQVDPRGATERFDFDLSGRIQVVTDARGLETLFKYDDHDRVTTMTVPGEVGTQRDYRYVYDAADQLFASISPIDYGGGKGTDPIPATVYRYDLDGNIDAIKQTGSTMANKQLAVPVFNPSFVTGGRLTEFEFDALSRNTTITLPDSTTESFAYDVLSRVVRQFDRRGSETVYDYNDVGWLETVTLPDPDGSGPLISPVWGYERDASSNVVAWIDPNGNGMQRSFDVSNRLVSTLDSASGTNQFAFDQAGRLRESIDPRGSTTRHFYDEAGQRTRTSLPDPDGAGPLPAVEYAMQYDDSGNLSSVTDHLDRVHDYQYDLFGRMTRWDQPAPAPGEARPYEAWSYGFPVTFGFNNSSIGYFDNVYHRAATGEGVVTHWDALGRVQLTEDIKSGRSDSYHYDSFSQLTYVASSGDASIRYREDATTPLVKNQQESTRLQYDQLGRVTKVDMRDSFSSVDPPDFTFLYEYDENGNLVSSIDHQGVEQTIAYDYLDRPTYVTDAAGTSDAETIAYRYDAGNRLTGITDAIGIVMNFGYDPLNRRTSQVDDVGGSLQRTRSWSYDGVGNLTSEIDALGIETRRFYDSLDRMTSKTDDFGGINQRTSTTEYDTAGNLFAHINGRGDRVEWLYDDLNRPISEMIGAGTTDALLYQTTYDAGGRVVDRIDPELVVTHNVYDFANRLAKTIRDYGGSDESTTEFGHTSLGRQFGVKTPQGSTGSSETITSFDLLNREIGTISAVGTTEQITTSMGYNDLARTITRTDGEMNEWVERYDTRGRMFERESPDPDGSGPRQSTLMSYQFNGRGDIVGMTERLTPSQSATTSYIVDALGRRVSMTDPINRTTTTDFDARDSVLQVTDPGGNALAYQYDNLARVKQFDDGGGRIVSYAYDGGGNLTNVTSPLHGFQYSFDSIGRMTSEIRFTPGSDIEVLTHDYDPVSGQLSSVTRTEGPFGSTTPISRESFQWDNLDRISSQTTEDFLSVGAPPFAKHLPTTMSAT